MGVNPDAANRLKVRIRAPREGSCLTPALVEELAQLIEVTFSDAAMSSQGTPCVSKDSNNLASLDPQNCLLVPAAKLFTEEDTWAASSGDDVEFTGFVSQGIDPTKCMFACYIFLDSTETGIAVQGDPSGTEHIRPTYEITELSADRIKIAVKNAAKDVRVQIQLLSLPVPQQPAA